jgi:hypothetical protein
MAECCYAEYRMLNVANNALMLSVIMLNVVMLIAVAPREYSSKEISMSSTYCWKS